MQNFLNGVQAKDLHSSKSIYQPGTLRKVICIYSPCLVTIGEYYLIQVSTKSIPLKDLEVLVQGRGAMKVSQMWCDSTITILLALPGDTMITTAGAVIGCSGDQTLINVGSYVHFSTDPGEVKCACTEHLLELKIVLYSKFQCMHLCEWP